MFLHIHVHFDTNALKPAKTVKKRIAFMVGWTKTTPRRLVRYKVTPIYLLNEKMKNKGAVCGF